MPGRFPFSVTCSADGTKLVTVGQTGSIYTSLDSGVTWTYNDAPYTSWRKVACSADGTMKVAVVGGETGGIYTSRSAPTPWLSVTPAGGNAALSWIVPSQPFVLQENSGLTATNWAEVPMPPVLNLTNLQNQVVVPLSGSHRFYRLKGL